MNYRPEYRHAWGSKTFYSQLRLDPLPSESADELLDVLLGAAAELRPLKQLLIERTEGNPFFLEESVRTLVETKMLLGERGARRLGGALSNIQVPATVQSILAARIDRLPTEDKHLLQCAAVIGKDVSFSLLRAITALPEGELRQSLSQLRAAEFLYETSLFPELEYTFKHALTLEVAYGSLLQQRRRVLHASIVEAIEAMEAERLSRHLERLAYHASRGEVWDKALRYARQAGAKAMERSAYAEAVSWLDAGVSPRSSTYRSGTVSLCRLDLRLNSATRSCTRRTQPNPRRLGEAIDSPRHWGTTPLGWVYGHMAREFALLGQPERAVAEAERALTLAGEHGDFGLQSRRLGARPSSLCPGAYARGADALRGNVAALEGTMGASAWGSPASPSVTFAHFRLSVLPRWGSSEDAALRGPRLAPGGGRPIIRTASLTLFRRGACVSAQGFPSAITVLERGPAPVYEKGIRFAITRTTSSLGHAYALSGRVEEGLPLLRRAVDEAEQMQVGYGHALWLIWLAEGHLLAGETGEASRVAGLALSSAESHGEQGHMAWALRLSAEIMAQRAEFEQAAALYARTRALATELGMRPLQAHCEWGLGGLHLSARQEAEARRWLEASVEHFRGLGMRFWLARAQAALTSL